MIKRIYHNLIWLYQYIRNWKAKTDRLIRLGRLDAAETKLNTVGKYLKSNTAVLTRLAKISEIREDWAEAAARWKQVAQIAPNIKHAQSKLKQMYIKLGNSYRRAGQINEALDCYRQAWSMNTGILTVRKDTSSDFEHLVRCLIDLDRLSILTDAMISERTSVNTEYIQKYKLIRDMIDEQNPSNDQVKVIRDLFADLKINECTMENMVDINKYKMQISQASSFRIHMIRRRRMKQLGKVPDRWLTSSKPAGYAFADMLGLARPRTITNCKLAEIPKQDGLVIKPRHNSDSRGVYIIDSISNIRSVKRLENIGGWDELQWCLREDINSGVTDDDFIIEEYISEDGVPARDLKFYTFYGKIGLVLEVLRYPERKNYWWDENGKPVFTTGKYEVANSEGKGVTPEQIALARRISLEIPAPFMRIDFLRSGNKIYFNEFCSTPGGFHDFNTKTDKALGDMYLQAELRLTQDLLNGKKFDAINEFNAQWENQRAQQPN